MTEEASKLLERALALDLRERAEMAGALIHSLDKSVDQDAEEVWQKEIARRMSEVESGSVKTIPWETVRKEAQAILDGNAKR